MKHKIPPMERNLWCANPHDFLDLEFDIVPIMRSENPAPNTTLIIIIINQLYWENRKRETKRRETTVFELGSTIIITMWGWEKWRLTACSRWLYCSRTWTTCKCIHRIGWLKHGLGLGTQPRPFPAWKLRSSGLYSRKSTLADVSPALA